MTTTVDPRTAEPRDDVRHHRVAIVGTGFAGLGMAIRMRQEGITDFVMFERADEVGGTWRDNTYPGAACDVPSHLYSFSFAPNPTWSRAFSPQREIQDYLRGCVDRFDLRPHIRFGHAVTAVRWDDVAQLWHVETSQGEFTAQVLVSAMGSLSEPSIPPVPGLESFTGTVFHSAQWNHGHDLSGERVAVVGTGASAIQFVPKIAAQVEQLDLFQRTPAWIIPRRNRRISSLEQRLFGRFPALQKLQRAAIYWSRELYVLGFKGGSRVMRLPETIARKHLAQQVPDPALREKLTPDYTIGCKRILISSDFYPVLSRPNVALIASGVAEVRERSVVAADGTERPADTIIFGTGFHVTDFPAGQFIFGRDGRRLADVWSERMDAYAGTTVHGFPNLFLLVGPNTGLGHTSMVLMIEAQVGYVLDALRNMARHEVRSVEVRADAQRDYNDRLQEELQDTVWTTGGCASWYLDDTGRNTTLWPDYTFTFTKQMRRFDVASYTLRPDVEDGAPVIELPHQPAAELAG